jgi:hypothetical protein
MIIKQGEKIFQMFFSIFVLIFSINNFSVRTIKREEQGAKGDCWSLRAYGSIHIISKNISENVEKGNKSKNFLITIFIYYFI